MYLDRLGTVLHIDYLLDYDSFHCKLWSLQEYYLHVDKDLHIAPAHVNNADQIEISPSTEITCPLEGIPQT
jgi:hypothetical protein